MTPEQWGPFLGGGGLFGLIASVLVYLGVRGANKTRTREIAESGDQARVDDEQARFDSNLALAAYVDARIATAVAPLKEKLIRLEEALAAVQLRERSLKDIVRRWFQRLTFWDQHGRMGEMPVPSPEDMHTLELVDLTDDTLTREELNRLTKE